MSEVIFVVIAYYNDDLGYDADENGNRKPGG